MIIFLNSGLINHVNHGDDQKPEIKIQITRWLDFSVTNKASKRGKVACYVTSSANGPLLRDDKREENSDRDHSTYYPIRYLLSVHN